MKRDSINLDDLSTSKPGLASTDEIVKNAHARWDDALRRNGNKPPPAQLAAGWQLLRALVDQLYGLRPGRFAYAIPCGGGKTQAVVALLTTLRHMRVLASGKTVLVVAQSIKALCDIMGQLLDAGVPEGAIGIVHSQTKLDDDVTYHSTGDSKRLIMLATHARLQQDGSLPECCRKEDGSLHDLVIWDEALVTTKEITLLWSDTRTALQHFAEKHGPTGYDCPTIRKAYRRLDDAIQKEQASQKAGNAATELGPILSEAEADAAMDELNTGWQSDLTQSLRKQARGGIHLIRNMFSLVDPGRGNSAHLMRYVVQVPDELKNIAILDASYAIDELRRADLTILDGSAGMTEFKQYDRVSAQHYSISSGRTSKAFADKVIPQVCDIVRSLPDGEGILIFTYKDWHKERLLDELRAAGIAVNRKLADGKPWLSIQTWGKHTTDNSFTHCKHVILAGLLRLPGEAIASQLAARKRDITHRRDVQGMRQLEGSVIAADVMQAMNRGCMRLTDEDGQAHAMTVHIIAKDDLRPWLDQVMPGLQWQAVAVKEPTRTDVAAGRIAEFLVAYDHHKISKKALFKLLELDLMADAKTEALQRGLLKTLVRCLRLGFRWETEGQSLVKKCSASEIVVA